MQKQELNIEIDAEKWLRENDGLIQKIVNIFDMKIGKFSREDLVQQGRARAISAIRSYRPDLKTKLSTYVYSAVHRDIRDFVRKNRVDLHYPQSAQIKNFKEGTHPDETKKLTALSIKYENNDESEGPTAQTIPSGSPSIVDDLIKKEQVNILLEEIERLPERERSIIKRRVFDGSTCEQIGSAMNISKQMVSKINLRGMDRLKKKVKQRIKDPLL